MSQVEHLWEEPSSPGGRSRPSGVAVEARSRGTAGLKSALLGSTSSGILHHTQRPVLVVHQDDAGEKP